ncbi:alpha/beta hydrolase fold protein [Desulforamulus reducens MI-1]|uniref:Alpha/beta hydrolase fold protein n=1 Tax=Desulforamulus reducens (strain ATCC BAA-1160 / DSM 100696 / MI-1) TaxID=349161 RepID=A4J1E8_DESRM|nr:alpha/beta hydrolase [Desulforamulus reducens]ABO48901.1 alpha/beta hydrolase fold protein [Desulforamulus reducens MI-1]
MPLVTLNSIQYYYDTNVPTLEKPRQRILFVHGAGGSHRHWRLQLAHLSKEYQAIAVDLPGHDLSEGNPFNRVAEYSRFIKDFVDCLLDVPFILVGHSMGGAIAMDFALKNSHRLAGLVLVGTGSRLRVMPQLLESFKKNKFFAGLEQFLYSPDSSADMFSRAKKELESVPPSVFFADFTACDNFNVGDRLGEITAPTLIISGEKDVMTPVKFGQLLFDQIPGAQISVIPKAGHMMMMERPREFNRVVEAFVKGLIE